MPLFARTCSYDRMNVQRIIARGLVLGGAAICVAAAVGVFARLGYTTNTPIADASISGGLAALAIVVFVLSLYYESLAAWLLIVGAGAVAVWGVVMGWDGGIWTAMGLLVIGPMIVSGVMYMLAAQTQKTCEMVEAAS